MSPKIAFIVGLLSINFQFAFAHEGHPSPEIDTESAQLEAQPDVLELQQYDPPSSDYIVQPRVTSEVNPSENTLKNR